jgi:hypothetical protein
MTDPGPTLNNSRGCSRSPFAFPITASSRHGASSCSRARAAASSARCWRCAGASFIPTMARPRWRRRAASSCAPRRCWRSCRARPACQDPRVGAGAVRRGGVPEHPGCRHRHGARLPVEYRLVRLRCPKITGRHGAGRTKRSPASSISARRASPSPTGRGPTLSACSPAGEADMAIRGILFDKDGTLIDFPSTWEPVLQGLALEFAKGDRAWPTTSWRRPATIPRAGPVQAGIDLGGGQHARSGDRLAARCARQRTRRLARWVDDYCERIAPDTAVPVTDLVRLFGRLRQSGFSLGVATNDVTRSAIGHHGAAGGGGPAVRDPRLRFGGTAEAGRRHGHRVLRRGGHRARRGGRGRRQSARPGHGAGRRGGACHRRADRQWHATRTSAPTPITSSPASRTCPICCNRSMHPLRPRH